MVVYGQSLCESSTHLWTKENLNTQWRYFTTIINVACKYTKVIIKLLVYVGSDYWLTIFLQNYIIKLNISITESSTIILRYIEYLYLLAANRKFKWDFCSVPLGYFNIIIQVFNSYKNTFHDSWHEILRCNVWRG